jgi:hypothetical protein
MSGMKRIVIYTLLFTLLFFCTLFLHSRYDDISCFSAHAEKEEWYTSSEEFLPVIDAEEVKGEVIDVQYLVQNGYITAAKIKGLKIRKDENTMLFILATARGQKELFFEVLSVGFPPRIIVRLYGVENEDRTFRFFKNIEILGVVSNPFTQSWISEYVIFFEDWVSGTGEYSTDDGQLIVKWDFTLPEFRQGYGVRIADTRIDPLPQVIEVMRKLTQFGLDNYLLVAQDRETVVLESPFYATKEEAVEYLELLERFGYKGKLAIRKYTDFPEPNRFDVVSEVVITGEDDTYLRTIVEREWKPERIHALSYEELYKISMGYFSAKVKSDENLISEYYYNLGDIYRNYRTDDDAVREWAQLVAVKTLEIIYFKYPGSKRAADALWDMANIIRDHAVVDVLDEEDCYRRILREYPESLSAREAGERIESMGK